VVYFRGAIRQPNPDGSDTFGKLPSYARPAHNRYSLVDTSTRVSEVAGVLYIGSDGTLDAFGGNAYAFTSLAAVSYPTAVMKSRKLTLKNGWVSSQPAYDTGDPSYAVSGGVVYLSGSLHAGTSHLAATLPKAARPNHELFVSVYTFEGAAGWLQIFRTGQVEVFGTDAVDYTSLANISYPVAGTKWHNFKLEDGWKSGQVKFHTAAPAYTIINGVVYLNGSMTGAAAGNLIWTTPPAGVRTAADVLNIEVDTAGGSVGDLLVTSRLGLVVSTPASNAEAFTSLAAIAYPQSS
jgi:hypothetical protein